MKKKFYFYHFVSTKSNLQMATRLTLISNSEYIRKHLKEAVYDAKTDPSFRYQMGNDEWV